MSNDLDDLSGFYYFRKPPCDAIVASNLGTTLRNQLSHLGICGF